MKRKLKFRVFRSNWTSWDKLFQEAADFADTIGPERVLNISHSCNNTDGVVTVWYWSEDESGLMFEINRVNLGD